MSAALPSQPAPSPRGQPSPGGSPPRISSEGFCVNGSVCAHRGETSSTRAQPARDRARAVGALARADRPVRATAVSSAAVAGVDRKAMAALSSGHLATDLAQGSLPALPPFLVDEVRPLVHDGGRARARRDTISSSLIQPAFGLWSDARGALWLLPAGVALAGVGMAAAAVAPAYWARPARRARRGRRRRRLPPGGVEVRELRERGAAGERHGVLLRRAATSASRSGRSSPRRSSSPSA